MKKQREFLSIDSFGKMCVGFKVVGATATARPRFGAPAPLCDCEPPTRLAAYNAAAIASLPALPELPTKNMRAAFIFLLTHICEALRLNRVETEKRR